MTQDIENFIKIARETGSLPYRNVLQLVELVKSDIMCETAKSSLETAVTNERALANESVIKSAKSDIENLNATVIGLQAENKRYLNIISNKGVVDADSSDPSA